MRRNRIFLIPAVIFGLFLSLINAKSKVKEYYITCNPSDFEYINAHPKEDHYIPITIKYGDTTWSDVEMRVRGDDTRLYPKRSLRLKFNGNVFYTGRKKINFNAEYEDRSYICQYLASRAMRRSGQACFKSEHIRLYLNGKFLGLYLQNEVVEDDFLPQWGFNKYGNLYKAYKDDASMSIYDDVFTVWSKKTNDSADRQDLITLIDSLNYVPDNEYYNFTHRFFDYDKMINVLAMNMLLANGSTYYHNYYMFHDLNKSNKWYYLPWDMDKTFFRYGYLYAYHRSSSYSSPDNPFLERAILCKPIFDDIQKRIDFLVSDFFNNDYFDPIIDSLKTVLSVSVDEDTADNTDLESFLKDCDYNKKFVSERPARLKYQFENWPTSFKVEFTRKIYYDSVRFVWHPSFSPIGKSITYDLYFGNEEHLDNEKYLIGTNLTDTTFVLNNIDKPGKYYWQVVASDGTEKVNGYNHPIPIIIKSTTDFPCLITSDTRFTKDNSPYAINCNVEVKPSANLTIERGVDIVFKGDYQLKIRGSLQVNGTKDEPVRFIPDSFTPKWQNIYFHYTTDKCTLKNAIIDNGCIYSQNSLLEFDSLQMNFTYQDTAYAIPLMYLDQTVASMYNSNINSNGIRQGFIIINADSVRVENSKFNNTPDAVEFSSADRGWIINNYITNSTDDGIDLNGSTNIFISNNIISNSFDKGISIGNEGLGYCDNVTTTNNIIFGCSEGFGIKDSSRVKLINNTLYNNKISVKCYQKRENQGGGFAEISNTIMSNDSISVQVDNKSSANISYSLTDDTLLIGEGNIKSNPLFVDADNLNFNLKSNSPCIDTGDPASPLDKDGSRADIGALSFVHNTGLPKIVINEINYNSANDYDTGDWIELYNNDDHEVDISNWIFSDSDDSHIYKIPDGVKIAKDGYLVLCRSKNDFLKYVKNVSNIIGNFGFGLSGSGELIRLFDDNGFIVDSLTYDDKSPWDSDADGKGPTLELISPDLDNSLAQSWKAYKNHHGTPGKKNGTDTAIDRTIKKFSASIVPNPVNEESKLVINIKNDMNLNINLYNSLGQELLTIYQGNLNQGTHQYLLNLSGLSVGIYYCRITSKGLNYTIPISLLK